MSVRFFAVFFSLWSSIFLLVEEAIACDYSSLQSVDAIYKKFNELRRGVSGYDENSLVAKLGTCLSHQIPRSEYGSRKAFDVAIQPYYQKNWPNQQLELDGKNISLTPDQAAAVSGVARTLWGEARSCEMVGNKQYGQFEAIGMIIANRSLQIQRGEANELQEENSDETSSESRSQLQRQDANAAGNFGRADEIHLDPAAQAISRNRQFLMSIHPISTLLKDGQSLCPLGRSTNMQTVNFPLWKEAVEIAARVVLEPKEFTNTYHWVAKTQNIAFFTHGGFVRNVSNVAVKQLTYKKSNGSTGTLPLFDSRSPGLCSQFHVSADSKSGR